MELRKLRQFVFDLSDTNGNLWSTYRRLPNPTSVSAYISVKCKEVLSR